MRVDRQGIIELYRDCLNDMDDRQGIIELYRGCLNDMDDIV